MATKRKPPSEEERAKRRRADREFARRAVEELQSSEGWQRWLSTRAHFHSYSFNNQLLIAMQRPDATRVAGFRAWLKLGYCVRRGERALRIWVPIPPPRGQLEAWEAAGSDPKDRPRRHFKLGPVFDREQVEPPPPPATPLPLDPPVREVDGDELAWVLPRLVDLAGEIGSAVEFEQMPHARGGYYELESRRIAIRSDMAANGQVKTLIHELAHALLRAESSDKNAELDRAAEELVVESVAFTVCGSLGLDTSGYSVPYLASWATEAEIETIEQRAALIDRLARRIEEAALQEDDDRSTA
jgi:antirestriction protein ArdC